MFFRSLFLLPQRNEYSFSSLVVAVYANNIHPALQIQRYEDLKFMASLGYTEKPLSQQSKNKK